MAGQRQEDIDLAWECRETSPHCEKAGQDFD
jgi:hypothetical protein